MSKEKEEIQEYFAEGETFLNNQRRLYILQKFKKKKTTKISEFFADGKLSMIERRD